MRPITLSVLILAFVLPGSASAAMNSLRVPLFGPADEARAVADRLDARTLAPISYADGMSLYQRADDHFRRAGSVETIRRYLTKAAAQFENAAEAAGIAAHTLEATIRARSDALKSDTASFAAKEWQEAESAFAQATKNLERGSIKSAQRSADRAEKAYRNGELIAIKANYLSETRDFIAMAEKLKAER